MEIKILDVDAQAIEQGLTLLNAKKVFDNPRVITYFKNTKDKEPFLKLTEENEKLKLSSQNVQTHEEVKLFVSKKDECIKLLATLEYFPISEVKARRISYELGTIDFDIDEFPGIPAFLEIDLGAAPTFSVEDLVSKLHLENNERGEMSTPQIVKKSGKDYFELYKLPSS